MAKKTATKRAEEAVPDAAVPDAAVEKLADGIAAIIVPELAVAAALQLAEHQAIAEEGQQAWSDYHASNEETKSLKKAAESIDAKLRTACLRSKPQNTPLLDWKPEPGPEPGPEAWRATPVADVDGISLTQADALTNASIHTAGDLQDKMRSDPGCWHGAAKGIGDAARTKIEDAFNAFVASKHVEPVTELEKAKGMSDA